MKRSLAADFIVKAFAIGIAIVPGAAGAVTVTLAASKDSWIAQSSVNANHGSDNVLRVRSAPAAVQRSLIQFDLSGIPACATISSALLRLTISNPPAVSRTHGVHKLTKTWTEAGVTWNTTNGATLWTTAGGDFTAAATATAATGTTNGAVIQWNLTADATTFITTPSSNLGWLIKDVSEAVGTDITAYSSKENGMAAEHPQLVVTYTLNNANCNDNNACTTDTCLASGCQHTNNTGPCNDGLFCNGADTCTGGACTIHAGNPCPGPDGDTNCSESCNEVTDTCTLADPNGSSCRPAAGPCDVAEVCSGGVCPPNGFLSGGICRASSGVCDKAETCTGSSANCPADTVQPTSTTCRASTGVCDPAEHCDGVGKNCPADALAPSSTVCRANSPGEVCDEIEYCTGSGVDCPPDMFKPATTVCRAASPGQVCDISEFCPGTGPSCPPDARQPATTVCRAAGSGQDCDKAEFCTGTGTSCPADAVKPNGTVCRASAGTCDLAETCNGSSKVCGADAKSTAVCRTAADECDVSESCDGSSNNCPADLKAPNDTPCPDGLFCNGAETCQAGVCSPGADPCPAQICDEPTEACTSCALAPESTCRTAEKSMLLIKNKSPDSKDKLIWKFIKGQATSFAEMSDPQNTADYTLCIYAGLGSDLVGTMAIPAAPLWTVTGNDKGYKYSDPTGSADGAQKIKLKSSDGNKTKALLKGGGDALPEILGPMGLSPPVIAQLVNRGTGVCWQGTYGAPKKNTGTAFSAKQ